MVWRVKSLPINQDRQFHKGYTLRRLMVVRIPQVLELAYIAERLVNSPAPAEGSPIAENSLYRPTHEVFRLRVATSFCVSCRVYCVSGCR